jgi:hypothetical protein
MVHTEKAKPRDRLCHVSPVCSLTEVLVLGRRWDGLDIHTEVMIVFARRQMAEKNCCSCNAQRPYFHHAMQPVEEVEVLQRRILEASTDAVPTFQSPAFPSTVLTSTTVFVDYGDTQNVPVLTINISYNATDVDARL